MRIPRSPAQYSWKWAIANPSKSAYPLYRADVVLLNGIEESNESLRERVSPVVIQDGGGSCNQEWWIGFCGSCESFLLIWLPWKETPGPSSDPASTRIREFGESVLREASV